MSYAKSERRQFPRVGGHTYTISFKEHNASELDWDISNTRNLSLGGALFLSNRFFPSEALVDIRLKIPAKSGYCSCRGKIQRCSGPFGNTFYQTAIYFTEIDSNYIEPLKESINFFSGEEASV